MSRGLPGALRLLRVSCAIAVAAAAISATGQEIPVPVSSAAAVAYQAVSDRFWLADQLAAPLVAFVLLATGAGAAACAGIARSVGGRRYLVAPLFALVFGVALQALRAPLDYFWVQAHARALGAPAVPADEWLAGQVRGTALLLVAFVAVASAVYWVLGRMPRAWWLVIAMAGSSIVLVALLVQPWTQPFTPLGNASSLDRAVTAVAARAGVPAGRIGIQRSGERMGCGAATVIGLGPTRLMLLDDTLVQGYPEGQILETVAHESSHFMHDDNVKAFVMLSSWILCALVFVHLAGGWALSRWHGRLGFASLADPASMPLVVLLLCAAYLAGLPFARQYQQEAVEQRADRFALELTHDNASEAMLYVKDMKCYPLMVAAPSSFYQMFRATHPSVEQRILFANSFHPWRHASNP